MTKQEIISELTKTGEIHTHKRTGNWEKAFKLYNDIHKSHKKIGCGSCFNDVKKWLQN